MRKWSRFWPNKKKHHQVCVHIYLHTENVQNDSMKIQAHTKTITYQMPYIPWHILQYRCMSTTVNSRGENTASQLLKTDGQSMVDIHNSVYTHFIYSITYTRSYVQIEAISHSQSVLGDQASLSFFYPFIISFLTVSELIKDFFRTSCAS